MGMTLVEEADLVLCYHRDENMDISLNGAVFNLVTFLKKQVDETERDNTLVAIDGVHFRYKARLLGMHMYDEYVMIKVYNKRCYKGLV